MSCLGEKHSESAYEGLVTQVDYPVVVLPYEDPVEVLLESDLPQDDSGGGGTSPTEDFDVPESFEPEEFEPVAVIQVIELQTMDEILENRAVVDAVVNQQVKKMIQAEESLDAIIGDLHKQKDREMALQIGKPHEALQ